MELGPAGEQGQSPRATPQWLSLHNTDLFKTAWYEPLLDLLALQLLGWDMDIQAYTFGI